MAGFAPPYLLGMDFPPPYDTDETSPALYSPPGVPSPPLPTTLPKPPAYDFEVRLILENRDISTGKVDRKANFARKRSEIIATIRVNPDMCEAELYDRIFYLLGMHYFMDQLCCRRPRAELQSKVIAPDLNEAGDRRVLQDGGWRKMALGLQRKSDRSELPELRYLFGCGCRSCVVPSDPADPTHQTGYCNYGYEHNEHTHDSHHHARDARRLRYPLTRRRQDSANNNNNNIHHLHSLHSPTDIDEYPTEWLHYLHGPAILAARRRREEEQMQRLEDQRAIERHIQRDQARRAQWQAEAEFRRRPFNERRRPAERESYEMLRAAARDAFWTLR